MAREQLARPAPPGAVDTSRELRVARQPILDRRLHVVGYELLFRMPATDSAMVVDDQAATSSVIVDSFLEGGLADLAGEHRAYVNVSRDFLLSVRPLPLPPDRVVLELLEDQTVDDALLEVLGELRHDGFQIALDDFEWTPGCEALLDLAQIVKLDVLSCPPEELPALVARVRERSPGVHLLAEKVEAREDFERCRELGFQSFQGYFFARPSRLQGRRMPSQNLSALSAMAGLNQAEDFDELLEIITRDPGLSMRLLRYANSAYLSLPRRVGSVQEALVLLGAVPVRRFALMVSLAGARDVPEELLVAGLVRARMCQLLAGPGTEGDAAFTVGLFSVADALADVPMATVLEELPLRADVAQALLDRSGPLGDMLDAVIAYERGEFDEPDRLERYPTLGEAYREAVLFADQSMTELV